MTAHAGGKNLSEEHVIDTGDELVTLVKGGVHEADVGMQPATPRQLSVHEAEVRAKTLLKVAGHACKVWRIGRSDRSQVSRERRLMKHGVKHE